MDPSQPCLPACLWGQWHALGCQPTLGPSTTLHTLRMTFAPVWMKLKGSNIGVQRCSIQKKMISAGSQVHGRPKTSAAGIRGQPRIAATGALNPLITCFPARLLEARPAGTGQENSSPGGCRFWSKAIRKGKAASCRTLSSHPLLTTTAGDAAGCWGHSGNTPCRKLTGQATFIIIIIII